MHGTFPITRPRIPRLVAAVAAALALQAGAAGGQAFDPASPAVVGAYSVPFTPDKSEAARAGLNRLLSEVGRFPNFLPNPPRGFGFEQRPATPAGCLGGICSAFLDLQFSAAITTHVVAGADADLAVLGTPVQLSGALLELSASFATGRAFEIGSNPGMIDTNGFDLTISGAVTAHAILSKSGPGTLTLTGNNLWLADILLWEGGLRGPAASLNATIFNSGVVEFDQTVDGVYDRVMTGSGVLTKTGVGTLTLAGANRYTGATRIEQGRVALQGAGTIGERTALVVADGASLDMTQLPATARQSVSGLSGGGVIVLGSATLEVNSDTSSTFAGVISGTGSVMKFGTGRLTLTGAQTYSGPTTVAEGSFALVGAGRLLSTGTLLVGGSATFDMSAADGARTLGNLSSSGAVVLGANALTMGTNNQDSFITGSISGTGALTKVGNGNLDLFGSTTHTGVTTIEAGTLRAFPFSLGPNVVNNATLVLTLSHQPAAGTIRPPVGTLQRSYDDITAYTGNISGTGRLLKQGNSLIWLRGDNSYAGGTTIEDGVLIGNDRSLQGNIQNDAGLAFYQAEHGAYAGAVSGTGILFKYGPGNLTLSGVNTHTGGTVFSGPLTINDDRNLGATGGNVVIAAGTLRTRANIATNRSFGLGVGRTTFDTAVHTLTIAGNVTGPGALTKLGTGTLHLTGLSNHTGGTTVSAGTFAFRNGLGSAVSVASGATLAGNGTVAGALNLAAGSTLRIAADSAGNSDRIVAHSANVHGALLDVQAASGRYGLRTRYNILLAANGVTGRFERVATNLAFLRPVLDYDAQTIHLSLLRTDTPYQSVAANATQAAVAGALGNLALTDDPDAQRIVAEIDRLPGDAARAAFDSVGGLGRASLVHIQQTGQRALTQQVIGRLSLADAGGGGSGIAQSGVKLAYDQRTVTDTEPIYVAALASAGIEASDRSRRHGFWLRGYGGKGTLDGSAGASSADYEFAGMIVGYDQALSDALRAGAFGAYSKPKLAQSNPGNSASIESRQVGIYGRYREGPVRIDAVAGVARNDNDAARAVIVGASQSSANASYDGKSASVSIEAGYTFPGTVEIEPIIGAQWSRQRDDGYAETGAGALNLNVAGRTIESVRSTLGVRAVRRVTMNDATLSFEGRIAWAHEFRANGSVSARLAGDTSGTSFDIPSIDVPRDSVIVGLGASVQSTRALRFYADVATERNGGQRINSIGVGLRNQW